MGIIDLEKTHYRVHREALQHVLRMYDVDDKLLSGIERMYVGSLACVRVKGHESEQFRIASGVRQGFIMSSWPFNVYMDGVMSKIKMGMGRRGVTFLKEGRERKLPGLL